MSKQSPKIVSSGGSPYKVFRDGVEIDSHSMEHTAITTASKEKLMYQESTVEINRSLTLRVELQNAAPPVVEEEIPVAEEPKPIEQPSNLAEGVSSFQTGTE